MGNFVNKIVRWLRVWHKWFGFIFSFFIIMFALSGIFLNHRQGISAFGIPRTYLPENYRFKDWNNGAIKGTFKLSLDSIILYGSSGVWLTDSLQSSFRAYTEGMLVGIDNRSINNIVRTVSGEVYAVTNFDLYKLDIPNAYWVSKTALLDTNERLADITTKGDSVIVISRSHAFISNGSHNIFKKYTLESPHDYENKVSLFRSIWTLHSGELFGILGRIVVDLVGVVFIVLCITGIIVLFFPRFLKGKKEIRKKLGFGIIIRSNLRWHNKLGVWFILISVLVVITGMLLRPPLMMHIVRDKIDPIPGSIHSIDNPWYDKLRNIRYDSYEDDWLMYTSDGFYRMKALHNVPYKMAKAPRTSVMGINVLQQINPGLWIVGSFGGLYYWDKSGGNNIDVTRVRETYLDGQRVEGVIDVSGYSNDFGDNELAFSYSSGVLVIGSDTVFAEMPSIIETVDMSLWHLSLETHVGRIYYQLIGHNENDFILWSGIVLIIIYTSGYIVYRVVYKKGRRRGKRYSESK